MKIRINEITEWVEDTQLISGDISRCGNSVKRYVEDERDLKDEKWKTGLPFICEAEDKEEALEKYNDEICPFDYLKASECDWDELEEEN